MEPSISYSILTLGFSLGLLHAFDADHIMAVSAMASTKRTDNSRSYIKRMIRFCSKWAIGHGSVLLTLAALFIFAKIELPDYLTQFTEKLVGIILIGLGVWIIYTLRKQKILLNLHSHDDITHIHLSEADKRDHNHQPVLVGVFHGIAGSAPVLALIPAAEASTAWLGLFYVLLFSLGVLIAMMIFGVFFSYLQQWLANFGQRALQLTRMVIGFLSMGFGGYWLFFAS